MLALLSRQSVRRWQVLSAPRRRLRLLCLGRLLRHGGMQRGEELRRQFLQHLSGRLAVRRRQMLQLQVQTSSDVLLQRRLRGRYHLHPWELSGLHFP